MEGTSGAAELAALRGATGEATLGPRRPGCASSLGFPPRERDVRRPASLRESEGSCDGVARVIGIQPVARRCRDVRCPSGSGWGEALVSGPHLRVKRASSPEANRRPKGTK